MRINVAIPESHVAAPVLDAALEATTRLNESLLASNEIPTFEKGLKYGVQWKPEPPGAEHFDHGGTVMRRKWGDCDDLAPWHAASLRNSGEDPQAVAIVKRSGPKSWHAVVKRGDGSIDDPSKRAGMGQPHEYLGATLPLMNRPRAGVHGAYIVRPQIALRPVRGGFQARADLPWNHWGPDDKPSPTDYAMASLHSAPVAATALTGAIEGAVELGIVAGFADPDHLDRLCCMHGILEGYDIDELARVYGYDDAVAAEQIVGSFLSHFNPVHLAKSLIHNPLTNLASNFIPGGRAALDAANFIPGMANHPAMSHPAAHAAMFPGMSLHCTPFG